MDYMCQSEQKKINMFTPTWLTFFHHPEKTHVSAVSNSSLITGTETCDFKEKIWCFSLSKSMTFSVSK